MIAALYVETNGVYYGLPDVDPWDEERDARLYNGPWPVVAHPPCQRWCRLAGMIETRYGYRRGDDGGAFASAVAAVRLFGGVLEHPAHSAAWSAFGLPVPTRGGGWTQSLYDPGASAWVEQGWYGHPLRKPTWLYAVGCELPALRWGDGPGDELPHRDATLGATQRERMTIPSPPAFRDVLLDMARSAHSARRQTAHCPTCRDHRPFTEGKCDWCATPIPVFACSSPEQDWIDDQRSEWDEFCENDRIANP